MAEREAVKRKIASKVLESMSEHKDREKAIFIHHRSCRLLIDALVVKSGLLPRPVDAPKIPPCLEAGHDHAGRDVAMLVEIDGGPDKKAVEEKGRKGRLGLPHIEVAAAWEDGVQGLGGPNRLGQGVVLGKYLLDGGVGGVVLPQLRDVALDQYAGQGELFSRFGVELLDREEDPLGLFWLVELDVRVVEDHEEVFIGGEGGAYVA